MALTGGQTGDALVDFTGGVNEAVKMVEGGYREDEDKKQELFHVRPQATHWNCWNDGQYMYSMCMYMYIHVYTCTCRCVAGRWLHCKS